MTRPSISRSFIVLLSCCPLVIVGEMGASVHSRRIDIGHASVVCNLCPLLLFLPKHLGNGLEKSPIRVYATLCPFVCNVLAFYPVSALHFLFLSVYQWHQETRRKPNKRRERRKRLRRYMFCFVRLLASFVFLRNVLWRMPRLKRS